jgi:simple sugar transport system ATP-binding protein
MIAHNYVHVFEVCDRVALLQDGRIALDKPTNETSVDELTKLVVDEYRQARRARNGRETQ